MVCLEDYVDIEKYKDSIMYRKYYNFEKLAKKDYLKFLNMIRLLKTDYNKVDLAILILYSWERINKGSYEKGVVIEDFSLIKNFISSSFEDINKSIGFFEYAMSKDDLDRDILTFNYAFEIALKAIILRDIKRKYNIEEKIICEDVLNREDIRVYCRDKYGNFISKGAITNYYFYVYIITEKKIYRRNLNIEYDGLYADEKEIFIYDLKNLKEVFYEEAKFYDYANKASKVLVLEFNLGNSLKIKELTSPSINNFKVKLVEILEDRGIKVKKKQCGTVKGIFNNCPY